MRHATRTQRLSLGTAHRQALLNGLVKALVARGQVRTTYARAKEAQRVADRLVTLGKDGSIHARRRAFRILQDRTLVNRLFVEIAPRFVDVAGGYTRVLRLSLRPGDGAQLAVLALSRLPAAKPSAPTVTKIAPSPRTPQASPPPKPEPAKDVKKPRKFLEGLRNLWTRQKRD